MKLRSSTNLQSVVAILAFTVLTVAGMGLAVSSGIDQDIAEQQGGSLEVGCTCHNQEPVANVTPILEGAPFVYGGALAYEPGTYNLTVTMDGGPEGSGGFNLHVSGGTLEVAEGEEDAKITDLGDATHSRPTPDRSWNLTWTSPDNADEAVIFRLTVNAVNGNGAPDPDDEWNRLTFVSQGAEGAQVGTSAGAEPIHVEGIGVNWLAYWVGIASFAFMIVIMIVYYFVFRYAETSHATDHRDRKKK